MGFLPLGRTSPTGQSKRLQPQSAQRPWCLLPPPGLAGYLSSEWLWSPHAMPPLPELWKGLGSSELRWYLAGRQPNQQQHRGVTSRGKKGWGHPKSRYMPQQAQAAGIERSSAAVVWQPRPLLADPVLCHTVQGPAIASPCMSCPTVATVGRHLKTMTPHTSQMALSTGLSAACSVWDGTEQKERLHHS